MIHFSRAIVFCTSWNWFMFFKEDKSSSVVKKREALNSSKLSPSLSATDWGITSKDELWSITPTILFRSYSACCVVAFTPRLSHSWCFFNFLCLVFSTSLFNEHAPLLHWVISSVDSMLSSQSSPSFDGTKTHSSCISFAWFSRNPLCGHVLP